IHVFVEVVHRRRGCPAQAGAGRRREQRVHHTGSHENTSPERSSGVSEGPNAPLSCSSSFCGVQPSERWIERIGRGWLNRKTSLLRTPKICPVMPSARSEAR